MSKSYLHKLKRCTLIQALWRLPVPPNRKCDVCGSDYRIVRLDGYIGNRSKVYRCKSCFFSEIKEDVEKNFSEYSDLVFEMFDISWFLTDEECVVLHRRHTSCRLKSIAPVLLTTSAFDENTVRLNLYGSVSLVHYLVLYTTRCGDQNVG